MKYTVTSPLSKDSANIIQPGAVIDDKDFTPAQIAGFKAAKAIEPVKEAPTPLEDAPAPAAKKAAAKAKK